MLSFTKEPGDLSLGLHNHDAGLNELLAVYKKPFNFLSPAETKMLVGLGQQSYLELLHMLPKPVIKQRLNQFFDLLDSLEQRVGFSSYSKIFAQNYKFVNSLEEFNFDLTSLDQAELEPQTRKHLWEAVNTENTKPKYSMCSTVTGRLTITSGLNFLVLPKTARKAVRTRNPVESVYELDLSALEPYIFLKHLIPDFRVEQDLYEEFSRFWFAGKIDRATSKQILISLLYGAGDKNIISLLDIPDMDKNYIHEVKAKLGMSELSNRLLTEFENLAQIHNMFGRPIFPKEANPKPGTLINNFIQSSAVDVALDCFRGLCDTHEIKPLFLVHDALYFSATETAAEGIAAKSGLSCSILENAEFRFKLNKLS